VVVVAGWALHRPRLAWAAAAAAQGAALTVLVWFPPSSLLDRRSTRALVEASAEMRGTSPLLIAVDPHPSLAYYTDRIPEFVPRPGIASRAARDDDALWVFEQDDWLALDAGDRERFRIVRRAGYFLLVRPRERREGETGGPPA
jgi:hypothetical protein